MSFTNPVNRCIILTAQRPVYEGDAFVAADKQPSPNRFVFWHLKYCGWFLCLKFHAIQI